MSLLSSLPFPSLPDLKALAGAKLPRAQNTKLLNWRTSQALPPAAAGSAGGARGAAAGGAEDGARDPPDPPGVVTAEGGRLIFTGDWCYESSFEGCNMAAEAAASAAVDTIISLGEVQAQSEGGSAVRGVGVAVAPRGGEAAAAATAGGGDGGGGGGGGGGEVCCGPCGLRYPRSGYSKNQWSKPDGRRWVGFRDAMALG